MAGIPAYLAAGMTAAEYDLHQRVEHSKKICEERTQEMIQEKMAELNISTSDARYLSIKQQVDKECRTEVESLGVNPNTGASAFNLQPVDRPLSPPKHVYIPQPEVKPEFSQITVQQEKLEEQKETLTEEKASTSTEHHVARTVEEQHSCPECEKERHMRDCITPGVCSISPLQTPPYDEETILTNRLQTLHLDDHRSNSHQASDRRVRDHSCDDPYCRMRYSGSSSHRVAYNNTPVHQERHYPHSSDHSWRANVRGDRNDGISYGTRQHSRGAVFDSPITCISTRSTPERDGCRSDRNQVTRPVGYHNSPSEHHRGRPSYQEYLQFLDERNRKEETILRASRLQEKNVMRTTRFHDDEVLRTAQKTEQDFEIFSRRLSLIEKENGQGIGSFDNRHSNLFDEEHRGNSIGGHSLNSYRASHGIPNINQGYNSTLTESNTEFRGGQISSNFNRGKSSAFYSSGQSATNLGGSQSSTNLRGEQFSSHTTGGQGTSNLGSGQSNDNLNIFADFGEVVEAVSATTRNSVESSRADTVAKSVRISPYETEIHQHSSLPLWMTDIVYTDSDNELEYELFQNVGNRYYSPEIPEMQTQREGVFQFEDIPSADVSAYGNARSTGGLAGLRFMPQEEHRNSSERRALDFRYLQKHWKELEDNTQKKTDMPIDVNKYEEKVRTNPPEKFDGTYARNLVKSREESPNCTNATGADRNPVSMHSLGSKLTRALHHHFGGPGNVTPDRVRKSFRDLKVQSPRRSGFSTSSCSPASTVSNLLASHNTGSNASSPVARSVSPGGSFQGRTEVINKTFQSSYASRTKNASKLCARHRMLSQGSTCSSCSYDSLPCNVYAMKVDKGKPVGSHHVCQSGSNKTSSSHHSFPSNGSSLLSKSTLSSTSFDHHIPKHKYPSTGVKAITPCKYSNLDTPCKYVPIKLKSETQSSLEYRFVTPSSPSYPKDFNRLISHRTPSPRNNLEIPFRNSSSPGLYELDPTLKNIDKDNFGSSKQTQHTLQESGSILNYQPLKLNHLSDTSTYSKRFYSEELLKEVNCIDQDFQQTKTQTIQQNVDIAPYVATRTATKTNIGKEDLFSDDVSRVQTPLNNGISSTDSGREFKNSASKKNIMKEQQKARLKLMKAPPKNLTEILSPKKFPVPPPNAPDPPPRRFDTTVNKVPTVISNIAAPDPPPRLNLVYDSDQQYVSTLAPLFAPDPPPRLDLIHKSHRVPPPVPSHPSPLERNSSSAQPIPLDNTVSSEDQLTESEKQFYDKLAQTEVVKASMTGAEITRLLRDRRMSRMSNITEQDEITTSQISVLLEDNDTSLDELNDNDLTPPQLHPRSPILENPPGYQDHDFSRSYTTSNFNFTSCNMQVSDLGVRCDSADSFVLHEAELKRQEALRRQETLRALNQRLDTIREEFVVTEKHREFVETDKNTDFMDTDRRNLGSVTCEIEKKATKPGEIETVSPVMKPIFNGKDMSSNFRHGFRVKHREKVKSFDGETIWKRQIEALKDLQRKVGNTWAITISKLFSVQSD